MKEELISIKQEIDLITKKLPDIENNIIHKLINKEEYSIYNIRLPDI